MSAPQAAEASALDLRLFLRCHDQLLSLDAAWIERILLTDEASPPTPATAFGFHPGAQLACAGVLAVAGAYWATWDLGVLLGRPPVSAAYLLLRGPSTHGGLRLALRTDRCLHVGPFAAGRAIVLPSGLARERPGLARAAFTAGTRVAQKGGESVGVDLDPACLWTVEEMQVSRELLSRAESLLPGGRDGAA